MIKLEDFVSETIKQVISGIKKAQEYAKENNAKVNPSGLTTRIDKAELWDAKTKQLPQLLDFDIAITTVEETETKGRIRIFVGPVGLGSQGQSHGSNTSESRIKFTVPLFLPLQD